MLALSYVPQPETSNKGLTSYSPLTLRSESIHIQMHLPTVIPKFPCYWSVVPSNSKGLGFLIFPSFCFMSGEPCHFHCPGQSLVSSSSPLLTVFAPPFISMVET